MLYTGGVSFFALLALFPAIVILIGFYKAVLTIGQVSEQAAALADVIPSAARTLFLNEIDRLANASARTVSAQSAIALVIGAYAAHRGFKALLAGLNLIHDETNPLGFFKFNMLAFLVALAAFVLFTIVSGAVVTSRLMEHAYADQPGGWLTLPLDGLWPALGLWLGLTMLYRYAMAHAKRVAWKAAIVGGLVFGGAAFVWSLIDLAWGRRGVLHLLYSGVLGALCLVGLANAFKHSQDGWSSVGALGVTLSALCCALALLAGWLRYSGMLDEEA
ncbi:hypothetical protein LTR94_028231, partial [Friedmanniomyces endolithicus]